MHSRRQFPLITVSVLFAIMFLLPAGDLVAAGPAEQEPEPPDETVEITSPRQGDTLRGLVPITGTVLLSEFNNYTLEFGFDPNVDDQWFPVQEPVAQQVQNGTLGQWDTTIITDGVYQLRIRGLRNDGTFDEFTVTGIGVANALPTVLPTIASSATPTTSAGIPTPGPSPTPLIQQPPTRTPRPTTTPGGPVLTPTPNPNAALTREQTRPAICRGVRLTLFIFLLLGLYTLLRRYGRANIRRRWRQIRRDFQDRGAGKPQ